MPVLRRTNCHERITELSKHSAVTPFNQEKLIDSARDTSKDDDKVSEPAVAASEIEGKSIELEPISLEDIRRQARENWLQLRKSKLGAAKGVVRCKNNSRDANGAR